MSKKQHRRKKEEYIARTFLNVISAEKKEAIKGILNNNKFNKVMGNITPLKNFFP